MLHVYHRPPPTMQAKLQSLAAALPSVTVGLLATSWYMLEGGFFG